MKEKHFFRLKGLFLLFGIMVLLTGKAVSADVIVPVTAAYNQTEARHMLDLLNNYRASQGQSALVLDLDLERMAMLRAAEIAVSYSHARPDGTSVLNAISWYSSNGSSRGENIYRIGTCTASQALAAFSASDGHNKNMLKSEYTRAGIGFCIVGDDYCWVQLFHSHSSGSTVSYATDSTQQVMITVQDSLISYRQEYKSTTLQMGKSERFPTIYRMAGDVTYDTVSTQWTSADTSIVRISGNSMTAVGAGSTSVSTTVDGTSFSCSVFVPKANLSNAVITLPAYSFTYSGNAFEPVPVVSWEGSTLRAGTDYKVSYANNIKVGKGAFVTVTGLGSYSNGKYVYFEITKAPQTVTLSASSTSLQAGNTAAITVNGKGKLACTSSNTSVVRVTGTSSPINVTAVEAGTAVITIQAAGDENYEAASAQITFTVKGSSSSGGNSSGSSSSGGSSINKKSLWSTTEKQILSLSGYGSPKNSDYHTLQAQSPSTGISAYGGVMISLKWTSVKGASHYVVFGAKGTKSAKYVRLGTAGQYNTDGTVYSIGGVKLKKGTQYKFLIAAVGVDSSGSYRTLAVSKSIHVISYGHKKYSNYSSIKLKSPKKSTLSVKKGKTYTIKASAVKPFGKKVKVLRKLAFESDNKKIATVSSAGKIKAKKKGTCRIYIYTQNGLCRIITVTVK